MKHIILFAAGVFLTCTTFAQNIAIQRLGSNHMVNDSVIVINASLPTQLNFLGLEVINKGIASISIKVKRIDSALVPNTANYLCWGLCYQDTSTPVFTYPATQVIAAGDTNKTFTGDFNDSGHVGTEIIRYVFFNASNPNDSAWVIFKFIVAPLGIEQITSNSLHISAAYPNPSASSASFNYHISTDAHLTIYNSIGQSVRDVLLSPSANKTNLNVSNMPSGIYICKLSAEGAEPVFQKLVVAH
ncbi:MAG TPA: T9SS type A sorting domain-containing protein [Bacteroidia bacterium]|jgi:hypothetical protein|nr:T9SS type A sorting domain-containing protein [Bacteroidia bacterium]